MGDSKISWTSKTWNPVTGCSKVSPGCKHCYAETLSLRFGWSKKPWTARNAIDNVILHPERLNVPRHWRKPARVFVNSMSDLFHELVPDDFIDQVFDVMEQCPQHQFQVLTKRPDRLCEYMNERYLWNTGIREIDWVPTNIWVGTSVEDQRRADERIPWLLDTPAAIRFLSVEPLLGPVDLTRYLRRRVRVSVSIREHGTSRPTIHWVICGGESGKGYRFEKGYEKAARSLRDQCQRAGVAFFHKQSPALRAGQGEELDGAIWHEYPQELQHA